MTDLAGLLNQKAVLIVEDEPLVAEYVAELLNDFGCKLVMLAQSIPAATSEISKQKPDLAVLDLSLNGILSYPLATVARLPVRIQTL